MMKSSLVLLAIQATAVLGGCKATHVNEASLYLIKSFEGWFSDVYLDPVGLETVGYGHLCQQKGCAEIKYPIPLSQKHGDKLLHDDLVVYEECLSKVLDATTVHLNPNQYGALVSWTFNVGCGAAANSTLVQRLNTGEDPNTVAATELPRWKFGGGVVLPGLARRRNAEVELFRTPATGTAFPQKCWHGLARVRRAVIYS